MRGGTDAARAAFGRTLRRPGGNIGLVSAGGSAGRAGTGLLSTRRRGQLTPSADVDTGAGLVAACRSVDVSLSPGRPGGDIGPASAGWSACRAGTGPLSAVMCSVGSHGRAARARSGERGPRRRLAWRRVERGRRRPVGHDRIEQRRPRITRRSGLTPAAGWARSDRSVPARPAQSSLTTSACSPRWNRLRWRGAVVAGS